MATKQSTIDFLVDQLPADRITYKKMFGEYALYYDAKVIAFVCDDQLFMKITPGSEVFLDESHYVPAYPGSKDYLCVPEEKWEEREWMANFVVHTANHVPPPKPKKQKKTT
jgi:DNA transformation protein